MSFFHLWFKAAYDWPIAMGLYMSGFIAFGCTLVLYIAMFPRLARNTPQSRAARRRYEAGETSREECEQVVSLQHNRISNISTVSDVTFIDIWNHSKLFQGYSNIGYLIMLCLNLTLLLPLRGDRVNIYVIVLWVNDPCVTEHRFTNLCRLTAYSVLTGIWWCTCGTTSLPIYLTYFPIVQLFFNSLVLVLACRKGEITSRLDGNRYAFRKDTFLWETEGSMKKIWMACKQYRRLPHTFIYLAAIFLLAGVCLPFNLPQSNWPIPQGINTTTTLVLICQNDQFSFGFLKITYLFLAQAITSVISLFAFWFVQKRFNISTKKMVSIFIVSTK